VLKRTPSLRRPLLLNVLSLAFAPAWTQTIPVVSPDPEYPAQSTPSPPPSASSSQDAAGGSLRSDFAAYFTAPLHWSATEWAWLGGSVVAISLSHHYDAQVRTHFLKIDPTAGTSSNDLQDALPTAAVIGATWLYASVIDDASGRRETWAMLEAAGFSAITAYAIKYTTRRLRPNQTSDPNEWFMSGGDSFPSQHSTVAFAVGTVLAESGNDDYRWVRRLLGYGLGAVTSYERLKHNTHWLSDVVAGAALGAASGDFAMHRREQNDGDNGLRLEPLQGGAVLTYRITFQ